MIQGARAASRIFSPLSTSGENGPNAASSDLPNLASRRRADGGAGPGAASARKALPARLGEPEKGPKGAAGPGVLRATLCALRGAPPRGNAARRRTAQTHTWNIDEAGAGNGNGAGCGQVQTRAHARVRSRLRRTEPAGMQARSGAGRKGGCRGRVAAGARQGAAGFAGTSAASRRHTVADAERLQAHVHSHDGSGAIAGVEGGRFGLLASARPSWLGAGLSRAASFPIMQCYAKKPAPLFRRRVVQPPVLFRVHVKLVGAHFA